MNRKKLCSTVLFMVLVSCSIAGVIMDNNMLFGIPIVMLCVVCYIEVLRRIIKRNHSAE